MRERCGLDILSVGEELESIPEDVMYCDWDKEIYKGTYLVEYITEEGEIKSCQLLDCDLKIDYASLSDTEIRFFVSIDEQIFKYKYSISGGPLISSDDGRDVKVRKMGNVDDLSSFLSEYPLVFYTGSLSSFHGMSYMKAPQTDVLNYRVDFIESVDWGAHGVDVTNECKAPTDSGISIQDYLAQKLKDDDRNNVIYFDHGTGEIADFIAVETIDSGILVKFYHCKKSGGLLPGDRVDDVYEVCGQSVKCTIYTRPSKLFERISYRFTEKKGMSTFLKGDLENLRQLICDKPPATIFFRIIAVQPGISPTSISGKLGNILASVDDYLVRERHEHFHVMGS